MPETVSTIEITWTVLSLLGLIWCWWLWQDAITSRHYWVAEGVNGGVEISTRANVRSSAVRTAKQTIYTLIGITAMTLPPPRYDSLDPEYLALIAPLLFIGAAVINVWDAVMARRAREQAIRYELARKGIERTP